MYVTLLQNRRFTFSLSILFFHSLEDIFASKFQNDWFAERTAPSVGTENVYDLQSNLAGQFCLNSQQLSADFKLRGKQIKTNRFKKWLWKQRKFWKVNQFSRRLKEISDGHCGRLESQISKFANKMSDT